MPLSTTLKRIFPLGNETYTLAQGLQTQHVQIKRWESRLNASSFDRLHKEAIRQNGLLPHDACGYDVWRGNDILAFVNNL